MTTTADTEIVPLLAELLAEIRGLRADLARPRRRTLSRADREHLSRLLRSWRARTAASCSPPWRCSARRHRRCTSRSTVSAHGPSGAYYAERSGRPVDGLLVQADGTEAHRTLWRVVRVI